MSRIVVVFPGQGAQKLGMARDFHDAFAVCRDTFDEASDAVGLDLRALCWEDDARLGLTEFTQPAILTAEIAMYRALVTEFGLEAERFGGHSLGEYSALVAAGALPLADAVQLVRERGHRMQEAVPPGKGAMVAILGRDLDPGAVAVALDGLVVDVANHNSPDQLVLSGAAADVDAAIARLEADPARARFRKLAVSAPFHSRLMAHIEPGFRALLEEASRRWDCPRATRVVSNYTGTFHTGDRADLVDALTRQISGAVRWLACMRALLDSNPDRVVEVGPGRPLRGFFRSLGAKVPVEAVTNLTSARRALG